VQSSLAKLQACSSSWKGGREAEAAGSLGDGSEERRGAAAGRRKGGEERSSSSLETKGRRGEERGEERRTEMEVNAAAGHGRGERSE